MDGGRCSGCGIGCGQLRRRPHEYPRRTNRGAVRGEQRVVPRAGLLISRAYLPSRPTWHLGGFLSVGGRTSTLRHNFIVCDQPVELRSATAARGTSTSSRLRADQRRADRAQPARSRTSGSATARTAARSRRQQPPNAFNVVYRDNVFQRGSNGKCAAFGPVTDFRLANTGNQWIEQRWDDGAAGQRRWLHRSARRPRDTDLDGLTDDAELRRYHTDPRKRDTDRDGLNDSDEVRRYHTDPRNATPTATASATARRFAATTPTRASRTPTATASTTAQRSAATTPTRANADTDRDGLKRRPEVRRYHTNPATRTPTATGGATEREVRAQDGPATPRAPDGLSRLRARTTRTRSMAGSKTDLAVIIVSHNSAGWLAPCLSSVYAKSGDLDLDVVVVDSGSTDDTVDLVRREFPDVRVLATENRGFAAANNRGLEIVDAEWVLFLNPDTEILSGTLEELVSLLRARPTVGLAGVRQIDENGVMDPTMRRFPNAVRSLSVSLGAERLPFHASWLGERVLDARALRPRDPLRLDSRLVHARTQGGDRRRRRHGRAVLSLLRGDRLLPSDATGRLGGRPSSPDDDLSSEQHDRLRRDAEPADGVRHDGSTWRSTSRPSTELAGDARARPRVRDPLHRPGRGPDGHAPTRRRALRARDAARARAAAVRLLRRHVDAGTSRRRRRTTTPGLTGGVAFAPPASQLTCRGETWRTEPQYSVRRRRGGRRACRDGAAGAWESKDGITTRAPLRAAA